MLELIIDKNKGYETICLIENGKLLEVYQENEESKSMRLEGNIYAGRVADIIPGMQAAFVDYGDNKKGFIHYKDAVPQVDEKVEKPLELNDEPTNENSNNLVNKSPMDIINENPFELNDVFTDGVIEPILAPEIHEDLENTVKESVQPMETEQIDDTETQNNDNI